MIFCADDTLYSKLGQASGLREQLELAFELESNLQGTVDWCRKWLVDCNPGKFHLVSFDHLNDNGAIYVKKVSSAVEEKSCFKMLGLTLSSKLN